MNVAGIDLSSHAVDVVLLELDSDEARWQRYELEGDDWLERLRDVRTPCNRRHSTGPYSTLWDDTIAIGVELPPVRPTHRLLPFFGAVVACLPQGPLLKAYAPAEWKRLSVGKGNASKDTVRDWAIMRRRFGRRADEMQPEFVTPTVISAWPQDAYDAYCIAWALRSEVVVEAVA